jgi:hypothetical protein
MNEPHCCYIDPETDRPCERAAEWSIYHGPRHDDYTHACTAHVGALLTDAYEHRVYPLTKAE